MVADDTTIELGSVALADPRHEGACQLIVEGRLSLPAIAARFDVHRNTLADWRVRPEFRARYAWLRQRLRDDLGDRAIGAIEQRVAALNDRWWALRQVIEERARDPKNAEVPGGTTGLLVHTRRVSGSGQHTMLIEEWTVDVGLLKEMRELEKQAAMELGQWTERREVSGDAGKPVMVKVLRGVSLDDL